MARAKNTSVAKVEEYGAVISARGKVRLTKRDEIKILDGKVLNKNFVKKLQESRCIWLLLQSMVKIFYKLGIAGAAELLGNFDGDAETLKNLAYLLYDICEKKSWAKEGMGYNELVAEWQMILEESLNYKNKKSNEPQALF